MVNTREAMQELGHFIHREGRYQDPEAVPFIEPDYTKIGEEGFGEETIV